MGFGFASGGLMIIVEIIFAKLTRRMCQGCCSLFCKILILLTLSTTLVAVTTWMIDSFYDPDTFYDKSGILKARFTGEGAEG